MASTVSERQVPLVADGLAALAIALACVSAVLLVLPPEGFIAAPLHFALVGLLGQAVFVLPALLLLGGLLRLVRVRPPLARLIGLALLLSSVLATEHLLSAGGSGMAGQWLAEVLIAAVGSLGAVLVLLFALIGGAWLTFGVCLGQK